MQSIKGARRSLYHSSVEVIGCAALPFVFYDERRFRVHIEMVMRFTSFSTSRVYPKNIKIQEVEDVGNIPVTPGKGTVTLIAIIRSY